MRRHEETTDLISSLQSEIADLKQISDKAFVARNSTPDGWSKSEIVENTEESYQCISDIAKDVGGVIVSTEAVTSSSLASSPLLKHSWSRLYDIEPLSKSRSIERRTDAPVVFVYNGSHFLGWQRPDIIRDLLATDNRHVSGSVPTSLDLRVADVGDLKYIEIALRLFSMKTMRCHKESYTNERGRTYHLKYHYIVRKREFKHNFDILLSNIFSNHNITDGLNAAIYNNLMRFHWFNEKIIKHSFFEEFGLHFMAIHFEKIAWLRQVYASENPE